MCCPTGVCGPGVDPALARVAADLDWIGKQGVMVTRHNLSQEPGAFVSNQIVGVALKARGNKCLPLVLLDGRIVAEGTYPSRETLAALAGIVLTAPSTEPQAACVPSSTGKKCC